MIGSLKTLDMSMASSDVCLSHLAFVPNCLICLSWSVFLWFHADGLLMIKALSYILLSSIHSIPKWGVLKRLNLAVALSWWGDTSQSLVSWKRMLMDLSRGQGFGKLSSWAWLSLQRSDYGPLKVLLTHLVWFSVLSVGGCKIYSRGCHVVQW